MDIDNSMGTDCGSGAGLGGGEQSGAHRDNCVRTPIKYLIKKMFSLPELIYRLYTFSKKHLFIFLLKFDGIILKVP